jgi:hypothetical protein
MLLNFSASTCTPKPPTKPCSIYGSTPDTHKTRQKCKTINSRYSLVVTHPTTNLPAHGLSTTERTGSPVVHVLWSIAMCTGSYQDTLYSKFSAVVIIEVRILEAHMHSRCSQSNESPSNNVGQAMSTPLVSSLVDEKEVRKPLLPPTLSMRTPSPRIGNVGSGIAFRRAIVIAGPSLIPQ